MVDFRLGDGKQSPLQVVGLAQACEIRLDPVKNECASAACCVERLRLAEGRASSTTSCTGCSAGVSPAVAGASPSRAQAGCPRHSGRDARATDFKGWESQAVRAEERLLRAPLTLPGAASWL